MLRNVKAAHHDGETDAFSGRTDLLGSNAEECMRLARKTRDRVIREELIRLAASYRDRARALKVRTAG